MAMNRHSPNCRHRDQLMSASPRGQRREGWGAVRSQRILLRCSICLLKESEVQGEEEACGPSEEPRGRGTWAPGRHAHQVKDIQVVAIFRREAGVCVRELLQHGHRGDDDRGQEGAKLVLQGGRLQAGVENNTAQGARHGPKERTISGTWRQGCHSSRPTQEAVTVLTGRPCPKSWVRKTCSGLNSGRKGLPYRKLALRKSDMCT